MKAMLPGHRCLSALVLIAVSGALAQSPLPLAPNAHVLQVSPSGGHYSEPGIAVNPRDPRQIVTVMQGAKQVQGTATVAYSNDGGNTFHLTTGTAAADWKVLGDVSTAFDNKGDAYVCYLAFDKLGTNSYWAHDSSRNGIYVRRSLDGGKTWEPRAVALKAFAAPGTHDVPFEDEPRIFADTQPNSPHAGTLYVGWVEWQLTQSIILFTRSTDQGQTWSAPIRISTHAGLPRDDNGSVGGFVQAVAPDGTIYALWADGNSLVLTKSHDGGKSFTPSRAVVDIGPPYFGDTTAVSRAEGFPQIAMDPSGRSLYVCWSDYRNGDLDVFFASSVDQGSSWSAAERVNNDPIHDGKDQFFQWMAADPKSGAIYVEFYDRRNDPANVNTQITLARSTDHGRTFRNYAWSQTSFNPGGAFLGDYTWLASYNDRVYAAWTEAVPAGTAGQRPTTIIRVGVADFSGPTSAPMLPGVPAPSRTRYRLLLFTTVFLFSTAAAAIKAVGFRAGKSLVPGQASRRRRSGRFCPMRGVSWNLLRLGSVDPHEALRQE